ncbi:MAG: PorT family protein [Saprospiraceae bacterium]|nr:PorT family protein [Saprospiraceae bacterium]MCF8251940.1 PorT family protein [Saprospiraceae bacterium]MCF8313604.1 PorT family protein [Saprospiraceae bacterium]MCF8442324.1 PorT family protein [Saprospiraceae bacterium]
MENNLDKYFRDNLHDSKFEMKEEYWLGAEKLLDEQYRLRKRRVGYWWFGSGLGVLVLALLAWLVFGKNDGTNTSNLASGMANNPPLKSEVNTTDFEKKNTVKTGDETTTVANENTLSGGATTGSINQILERKNETGIQVKKNRPAIQTTDNQRINNSKTRSLNSIRQPLSEKSANAGTFNSGFESSEKAASVPATTPMETMNSQVGMSTIEKQQTPGVLLQLPYSVIGVFQQKDLNTKVQKIDVMNLRRLHFGLMASQMLMPKRDSGEVAFIGQRAGLVLLYDLGGDWHFSSGLQYFKRVGTFSATKSASQRNYRFGLEQDSLELRPTSLHYLSLPVMLGWHHNRHQLEAGVLLDFLTGVHGKTSNYQKTGEPPVKVFKADKKGWVTTNGYRRFVPMLQLSYSYNLVGNWSLGLSANYRMGAVLDKNFEPPVGSFLLKETEKFHVGAQVVYLFN